MLYLDCVIIILLSYGGGGEGGGGAWALYTAGEIVFIIAWSYGVMFGNFLVSTCFDVFWGLLDFVCVQIVFFKLWSVLVVLLAVNVCLWVSVWWLFFCFF